MLKIKKRGGGAIIILFLIMLSGLVLGATSSFSTPTSTTGSFSQVNAQYFSPSLGSSYVSNSFSGYMGGSVTQGQENQDFFDMQLFIPPFSCEPAVVRSDLLEEQNVPVFCKLASVKLNPGIDITRIQRLAITQKENNPYIAGVGFHPARAAIASLSNMYNNPTSDNLGYVVVVLKRQDTEQQMPDNVTVTLAASVEYGANNAYGIGENEFYLPVLTDSEFENNMKEYSFFDGQGYLRVQDIDETSAVVSIYSYDNIEIFSDKIEKGKTSRDFYLPNGYWGQRMRITLKEVTIPQTKAKFNVNGQIFDVYEGGRFYDSKCRLVKADAISAGTGTARVTCGSKTFDLVRKLNKVSVEADGLARNYGLGEKVDAVSADRNFYLVFAQKDFIILANTPINYFDGAQSSKKISRLMEEISGKINNKGEGEVSNYLNSYNGGSKDVKLFLIKPNVAAPTGWPNIIFRGLLSESTVLDDKPSEYFKNALDSYDYVKDNYEGLPSIEPGLTQYTYGVLSLWKAYELADSLGQKDKKQEILSRIVNEYPSSLWKGRGAQNLLDIGDTYSEEGSSNYSDKENIAITLLSVNDPSKEDISADVGISLGTNPEVPKIGVSIGDELVDESYQQKGYFVVIRSITKEGIYVNYSCPTKDNGKISKSYSQRIDKTSELDTNCNEKIKVSFKRANLREIAHIILTPNVYGRSRENNFTFSIGIEKRPEALKLTPEEANKKIEELNKQIAEYNNITESLAEVIKIGKIGCFATSTLINLKNLYNGMSGGSTARTQVMSYWNKKCESVEFQKQQGVSSIDDCIAKNGAQIEKEVVAMKTVLEKVNNDIKGAKDANKAKGSVNDNAALEYRIAQDKAALSTMKLIGPDGTETTKIDNTEISAIINNLDARSISFSEYAELKKNYEILQGKEFSQETKNASSNQIYASLSAIKIRQESLASKDNLLKDTGEIKYSVLTNSQQSYSGVYTGYKFGQGAASGFIKSEGVEINDNEPVEFVRDYNSQHAITSYIYVLQKNGEVYTTKNVYKVEGKKIVARDPALDINVRNPVFSEKIEYNNKCKNCNFMKVFILEPYKGQPALLPFDDVNGWYVQTKQLFPGLGTKQTYQDSGKISSFWLCNVGKDGMMDGVGVDNDCARFDLNTGNMLDSFAGLDEKQTKQLVLKAIKYITEAQIKLAKDPKMTELVLSNGMKLKVQGSEGDVGTKCTDFMSAKDCQMIFNFCDPFVCPNSRCDLGGKFRVDNVIQSGIVGSTFLCLPNFIGLPGNKDTGVVLPICVTGIHAGINAWVNILESYRDCLNESIQTNRTVGICDEIQSFYACEFFWRQAQPFAQAITKNLFLTIFGRNEARGGGEYLFVKDAWNNAEQSMNYMDTVYGKSSNLNFGVDSIASTVGDEVCKMSVSATYPNNLDAMLEPESPVQFHAFFEEATYTTATVPASSRYKVFYVISAGNDSGHYYTVYLKSLPTSLGYTSKEMQVVVSGYVQQGGRASETRDFIDVSGYQQVCVRIDTQEECGFKSVSTSFALNYLKDQAVKDQTTNPVTTETECIAGTQSAGAFLTPNIGQGVNEFVNPELYDQGVVRICANKNPGEGTEPSRWSDVGYCGNTAIRCWVDANSVKKAIGSKGIENQTLSELEKMNKENLLNSSEGYLIGDVASGAVDNLLNVYTAIAQKITSSDKIESASYDTELKDYAGNSLKGRKMSSMEEDFKLLDKKLVDAKDRARLAFGKAEIYATIAKNLKQTSGPVVAPAASPMAPTTTTQNTEPASPAVASSSINEYTYLKSGGESSDKIEVDYNSNKLVEINVANIYYNTILVGTYNTASKTLTIVDSKVASISEPDKTNLKKLNGAQLIEGQVKLFSL